MKILIADDEMLSRKELAYMIKDSPLVSEIIEADSAEETAKQVAAHSDIDLVFLDIQLGDGNGITLGKEIAANGYRPRVVFATAYDEYALDAFDANAVDYILKPFEQSRVNAALKRAAESLGAENGEKSNQTEPVNHHQQANPRLSVTEGDKTSVVNKSDIIYATVESGSLLIQTKSGKYVTRQTMNKFASLLNPDAFLRVHRSYIVNLNQVRGAEPSFNHTYELTMSDGSKVPVGRSYINDMKESLGM